MILDRREFLASSAGASAAWLVGCAGLGQAPPRLVFRHGVASGDPLADGVILWTRVTPPVEASQGVAVRWRIARDPELRLPVGEGDVEARPARDYTVKLDVRGLRPGTPYYYAFEALGERSSVGRTRTLPVGSPERLRLAFASCSNYVWGYFNAYALMARRSDLDAVLHLGDYIYEHANGVYGDGTRLGRIPEPDRDLLSLDDYRTRYAQYRRDPDLQAVHERHPMIAVWDDHEMANDAWKGGAKGHAKNAGPWRERRRAAARAYLEWMPIREVPADTEGRIYRSFRFGDLAELLMLDTRLVGRDSQVKRDDPALTDPGRSILGAEQERWLFERLEASQRDGVAWRVLGQQVMMASLRAPNGRIYNPDAWDGYPASRARLFDFLASRGIDDNVVLTGDVHSSWANDLPHTPFSDAYDPRTGQGSLAVEFICPGVSSPGTLDPEKAERRAGDAMREQPHVKWAELFHRGYAILDVDPERTRCEWWFVDTVEERSRRERRARAFVTRRGANHLEDPAHAGWRERLPWPR